MPDSKEETPEVACFFGPPPERHPEKLNGFQPVAADSPHLPTITSGPNLGRASSQLLESDQAPENIRRLIDQYEQSKGKEVNLPFITTYRHEDLYRSKRGQPCQWVCLKTAKPVEAEQFLLRRHQHFIVVRGGGLPEPAIIHTRPCHGAPPNSRFYFFWKGLEGDEEEPSILRIFGTGSIHYTLSQIRQPTSTSHGQCSKERHLPTMVRKRSHRSDSESYQPESDIGSPIREARFHRRKISGGTIICTSGQREESEGFESPLTVFTIPEPETEPIETPCNISGNAGSPSRDGEPVMLPVYRPLPTSLSSEMAGRTFFIFRKDGAREPRIRPFSSCETVGRLFMHARLGGLSKSKDLILSVQIPGSKEILHVGEDDEADFYNVLRAVKADSCWTKGDTIECKVDVRAVFP